MIPSSTELSPCAASWPVKHEIRKRKKEKPTRGKSTEIVAGTHEESALVRNMQVTEKRRREEEEGSSKIDDIQPFKMAEEQVSISAGSGACTMHVFPPHRPNMRDRESWPMGAGAGGSGGAGLFSVLVYGGLRHTRGWTVIRET